MKIGGYETESGQSNLMPNLLVFQNHKIISLIFILKILNVSCPNKTGLDVGGGINVALGRCI